MNALDKVIVNFVFGGPYEPGPGLPDPIQRTPAPVVNIQAPGARLVNKVTNTYEWDIATTRPTNAPSELTNAEVAELEKRGQKNWTRNAKVKMARVQGKTIAEAAKFADCGFSTAQKIYAALSQFE